MDPSAEPNDRHDIWVLPDATGADDAVHPALTVSMIEGVVPLDDQFGLAPKKTVPDALGDALFGRRARTGAEAADGDPANAPQTHTYAILDAAKVANLPEMLEASGLEHRSLFKGKAQDDLIDVAPWIVRLEEENEFTRHLFTKGDAPWQLWDKEPGFAIRTDVSLAEMWRHFRKFTRVQDETGKWFYLRFWERDVILDLLRTTADGSGGGFLLPEMALLVRNSGGDGNDVLVLSLNTAHEKTRSAVARSVVE